MNTITINEDVLNKEGLTLAQCLLCLLVAVSGDINQELHSLIDQGILVPTAQKGKYLIKSDYVDKIKDILLNSDKEIPKNFELESLYERLKELFPTGRKTGTSVYWRGNRKDVIRKLQVFTKNYGKYSADQIYEATKHYVERMQTNLAYMRTLPYFIGKFGESDLATELENMNEDSDFNNTDWTESIC